MRSLLGLAAALAVLCGGPARSAEEEKPKSTLENLKAAYQGATDAQARYAAYAAKADEEGFKSVASLFRAAAKSEEIRLPKLAAALKELGAEAKAEAAKPEVKSTKENLEFTVKDKTAEKDTLLPAWARQAEAEKQAGAARTFKAAVAANGEYVKFGQQALEKLDDWKAAGKEFLVCQVCTYVSADMALKLCPICSAPRAKFESFK
jgi:rubrerythrin